MQQKCGHGSTKKGRSANKICCKLNINLQEIKMTNVKSQKGSYIYLERFLNLLAYYLVDIYIKKNLQIFLYDIVNISLENE